MHGEKLELEARLGRTGADGGFCASVTRERIDHAVTLLSSNPDIQKTAWREHQDTFWTHEGGRVRTRGFELTPW